MNALPRWSGEPRCDAVMCITFKEARDLMTLVIGLIVCVQCCCFFIYQHKQENHRVIFSRLANKTRSQWLSLNIKRDVLHRQHFGRFYERMGRLLCFERHDGTLHQCLKGKLGQKWYFCHHVSSSCCSQPFLSSLVIKGKGSQSGDWQWFYFFQAVKVNVV